MREAWIKVQITDDGIKAWAENADLEFGVGLAGRPLLDAIEDKDDNTARFVARNIVKMVHRYGKVVEDVG